MRELASSFAQLVAIIMVTLVLAVSTAAVSLWATSAETSADSGTESQTQSLLVTEAK
jgi:hypothetical protein